MTETTTEATCANCAATLTGPFCANCGAAAGYHNIPRAFFLFLPIFALLSVVLLALVLLYLVTFLIFGFGFITYMAVITF